MSAPVAPLGLGGSLPRRRKPSCLAAEEVTLRLELSSRTLLRLLAAGQVCAAEFRCLDRETRQQVRRLLLQSCLESIRRAYSRKAPGANHDIDWQKGE